MEMSKEPKIPNCQECGEEAEFFWKDGKDYLPVCQMCAERWAFEDIEQELVKIEDLEEGEIMDYIK